MSAQGHALPKQLAQAAAQLVTAGAGDLPALVDLVHQAVAAVTAPRECQLSLKDRLACCQLLEQLLQTPVEAGHVSALQQQPTNPAAPSTQALFQQVLGQLPGLTLQQQQQQEPQLTQPASRSSCLVLQLVHEQELGACLHLPALLQSAAEQLQEASVQEPGGAKWLEGQAWQLGQQLLQLAATTSEQAVQQQLVLAGSGEVQSQLFLRLVDGLHAALAVAEGTGGAAVAAVMSAAELVFQSLAAVKQLGLLDSQGCCTVHRGLLQLVLPPVGSAWPDLSCPDTALQPPVAGQAAAALEQCHPQRLQVLSLLLRQENGASWEHLTGLLAEDPASGSTGWDVLLQLVLSVLQAVAALQAAATATAAAAAEATARQAAKQEVAHDTDSEQDYFHDIFGSDGADDDGSRATAAAADSSKPAATPEQALCQLAAELLTGLAAHMSTAAPGSSSWGTREQRMLQLAMCCVALDLPQNKQQDEEQRQGGLHSLAGVQQAVQDAVVQWCGSSMAAAQQLQQVVLLTAPAAGHARSPALVHVAAQVVMQHAAAAAAAGDAELRKPLLQTPWVHLATQLACVVGAAANTSNSVSVAELQQQLAWLLCPRRLSLILAAALAAPAAERALLAAVMLHALERSSTALAAVTPRIAAQAGDGPEQDAAAAAGDAGSAAGLVSPHALALCALHACLSALLWMLLPPALLPTGWLQRHLQSMLQAPVGDTSGSTSAAEADGTSGAAVQLRREPWPVGLAWVAALLQYQHDTDELPTLLESLGVSVDGAAQEALAGLLPGFVPSCLPGMAAAGNTAAAQEAAQRMQEPGVLAAALVLLQDQHSSSGASWHNLDAASCSSVLTQLLDSVLPAASAAWASNAECSNVAAAVAQSCCQERALQLLLVLQDQRQQDDNPAAGTAAGGFNMFGSYQHLVQLQQQLAQLLAECATLLQDSSSSCRQLIPCQLSLTASSLTLHQLTPPLEQQPAVAAMAARLAGVLAGALSDAVQRFRLCDSDVSTPRLLRQQLHTCCAEIELLGHTMQAARVLLLPHLPELLPLLSQLQWQVAHMQLRCLSAALSTCYSLPGSSRVQQAQWLQVLLTLCTDVDYAADAVDAVHEGLGYCLLASLCETHGPGWPSMAEPSDAVAAVATAAAALQGASAVEAAAARCVAELMVPGEPAQQPGQPTDWLLLTQELDLLHSCLAPVPLPQFWPVSSLNRACGCIAAVGACLAASAAMAGQGGSQQPTEQEQPKQEASAPVPAAAAAAVAEWMLSMEQLEHQLPLLLRPLQLQHAHLLEAAAGLVASCLQAGSSTAAATVAPKGEPKGVEAVLVDVSAALGAAVREAAAAGDDGDLSAASALAAAAVSRLRDAAEGADGYGTCASLHGCSTAAQLVQSAEQQQQQQQEQAAEQHGGAGVLQQLWHCVAIGLVQTSRVVDLIQQVTGALHGSDDPQAQALHDSFLQQLRASLLQLPQQRFDQLLLQQLSTRDAFASNGSGVCRELWQQLLGAEEPASGDSAVQLLQRLLAALLQLTFSTEQAGGTSGPAEGCGGMGRKQLAAVSLLLGVVMTCATALGLPGVLACCTSLKALAAASADWADASACGSSSTEGGQQTGCAEAAVAVTERLVPFLPLLLFVQRVVSQSSTGTGRASSRSRAVRKSDSAVSRSSRESVGFSAGAHSQTSETGEQQVGSRRSSSAGDAQETSAAQHEQVDSDASTVSGGPFEAAASSLVLQDDAVQVLGGAAPAAHFEEEEDFLDEFEDEEEYLAQLLHNGALAAAAGGGGGDAQQPGGAGAGASGAAAAAPQAGDRDRAGDATSDEDASSSDSDESAPEEGDNPQGPAQPAAAPGGSSAVASAAPAGGAAAAAAAAVGAAFGAAAGEGVDEDEQALLDEEFAALLQELLAAGAAPDVALAAVTAATGMAPPAAAVAAATEAAAASGDDEMVAVVEQLAAGAAAAAAAAAAGAAGEGAPSTAATSHTTSPVAAQQAGASAGREQGTGTAAASGAGGGSSSSSRRARHRRASSDSEGSRYLPQLRRYWRRTHHQQAEPAGAGCASSGPEQLHCTFAVHGDQFVEQHWFQCYTCGLTDSRGCCSACVRVCHAGHDVVYAAKSRFFCDCGGENGPRGNAVACKCLTAVPVLPLAPDQSSSSSSSGAGGSSSSSSLVQQGWLLPAAANPLARAGLAASLPDPLDAAWAFDPQLYPDAYAAATGSNGSSSSKPSSKQQASAELLLHSGAAPRVQEQHAAAAKFMPQGLVAKAARALAAGSDTHAVLQDVAGSALQLSQLLLSLLRSGRRAASTTQVQPVLPAVLQTKELVMEPSSSSTKVLTKASTGSTDKAAASSEAGSGGGSSGSSGAQQQLLVDLQRVIRLGTMSSSSSSRTRTRSSSDYGADSSSSGGSRGLEVPPEVTAALEGGVVCQQSAAAARQRQLLAVCRGESVGLMDGRLLAAELCGRDIFSKEEISAAVALTSKALSPSQAPGSSSSAAGNDAGGGGSSSGAASSYFYVRRHAAKFHVLALHWDLLQGRRLLVVGYDQVQVWSVQQRDLTIADRLPLQLPLMAAGGGDEAGRLVLAAAWLPDSDTWVAVSTPLRVFLFDLTHSATQPAVVMEPQGHVLLSGGAAFVPRLVQQQKGERQGQEAEVMQPPSLQQQLYVLLLTRDGQLLSAEVPPQLLDKQQSCAAHWPHASCLTATSSSAASQGPPAAAAAGRSVRPSSSDEGRGRDADSDAALTTTASSSSSVYGCPTLVAQAVTWPSTASFPQLQTGRSCHWLQAYSLLAVAGTWQSPAAAAGDSADSSSAEAEEQQLLLQLDATCTSVLQCCRWDTAAAAAPILGSPKPLLLSPASVYWDLPLLPAARASYGAVQLFAVAPGQARKLLNGTGSSTSSGQGCAYIAGLMPTARAAASSSSSSSSGGSSGVWQAVVQPLHLRHSSAGAVVDGLAVLSFPYTQQLLVVVLCSKGNMYMYTTRRPPGLAPMQPFTQLLRTQLMAGPQQQQQQQSGAGSMSGAGEGSRSSTPAAAGDAQQGLSRHAAAVALATGALPDAEASQGTAVSDGTQQQQQSGSILPADASILLLQHSQNLSSHLSVSGDISRAGSAEAAARALFKTPTDPERRLEGPSPGAGMTLVVKIAAACDLQPVGMKLLLPGGGAAPTSVKLTFGDGSSSARSGGGSGSSGGGGRPNSIAAIAAAARSAARAAAGAASGTGSNARSVQLAAPRDDGTSSSSSSGRHQRWHQVILSPEESAAAAAAGQATLEFGPPVDPERRVAVCHLDLFGQPGEVVAQRAKQQLREQEEEQVLSVDTCCTAAGAAVPAVLMPAGPGADAGSSAATASMQLLLNAMLQTGAAAAAAAAGQTAPSAAAVPDDSSSSQWQQQVLGVVKQLLCPDAQAAAVWSPSWQCEAAAHALAATAADDSAAAPADTAAEAAGDAAAAAPAGGAAAASAAALAVQDGWKLSQAVAVLREFGMTAAPAATPAAATATAAAAEGGPDSGVPDDAAVFGFLHAMAQLQSVLHVRPGALVDYLRQHSSSSGGEGLAACASSGLVAAVFALKQLSSATLLPCELLAPLAKTAVELWLAEAAACQQQQEGEEAAVQRATAQAAQGLLGLLLSSDAQVRLHAAAAWVQAVRSSSSSRCAVFAAAAELLLAQQQVPCSQLLPAYQAVADVVTHLLRSAATAAAAGWPEGSGASAQAVAQVVRVLVQQLSAVQQQQSGGSLSASTAEQSLLLQLLLARVLSAAWEQQQQQQQVSSSSDGTGSSTSGSAAASSSQQQQHQSPQKLHRQLLPPALLQQLASSLLGILQSLVPLLQQQQQQQQPGAGGVYTVLPGEGAQQAGPGGYNNYQALLPPPPAVSTWGVSRSCCQSLLGGPPAATTATAVTTSSSSSNAGDAWLLDPFLQGGQSVTRLLQGLPLQLAAAAVDLTHSLLQYGLVGTAVGSVEPDRVLAALSCSSSSSQPGPTVAAADTPAGTAGLWCGLLCHMMDLPSLHPVRRLAKQVVLDMCGSLPVYREVRSLHLLSNHTAVLRATLGLPQQQQQQQEEEEQGEEEQGEQVGVLGVAAGAVAALQASWQQQCAVASCLMQLLSVAESQPVAWACVCSSSSSAVVPLLMQLALSCKVPQLSLTAVKLVNAALLGAVKTASSSSKGKAASSKGAKGGSSAADATQQQPCSSSSSKASAARVPVLDLSWLLPQQQPQQSSLLSVFIDRCVVGWPEVKERREAAKTLVLLHKTLGAAAPAAASGGSSSAAQQQGVLLQTVLQAVPAAGPLAGAGSLQLFSAANQLLKLASQTGADSTPPAAAAAGADQGWTQAVSSTAGELFATAAAAAAALAVHPCVLAYQQLQELMEFQQPGSSSSSTAVGYWLELCGCDVAGGRLARKPPNTAVRLDSIAAELKFGDRQVIARLAGWYSVHKLLLVVHSPRKSKAVSSLRLWYCDSPVSDLQQLKQQGQPSLPAAAAASAASAAGGSSGSGQPVWKLAAAEVPLSPGQTEVTVSFELPLLLSCLMVEWASFHVSVNESSAEVLHCPRCSHVVTDKHGLCGYCRENAYQCRQCRHINYEAPDAFICSECGHSRYGRFELLLQAGKAPACPPLLAQANLDEALSALDTAAAAAAAKATALQAASAAVQQQAAALATAGFHHTPDAPAAATAGGGGSSKRGSSGGTSSSSAESLMRPGLRHLAELYTERCKPAFEEALQAAREHAAVQSAIAEAEAATGSSSSGTDGGILAVSSTRACAAAGDAGAAAALFSSCSFGHTSAVLSASIKLLRGGLAAAPATVTAAAQQQHVLPGLLALLARHGSMHSLPSVGASGSSSSSNSSSLVSDVRSLLLGLCRADPSLHDQLLTLLQQQLLAASPAAADSSTSSKPSGGVTFGGGALSGHQLQLLLMVALHDVQHLPKDPTAAAATAAAGQRGAAAPKLVLQLLQLAVAGGFTEGLWPELLLLPGLKVMAGTAAVQQLLAKAAAAQAAQDAADAAAAASAAAQAEAAAAAAAAAASQPAATADSVVEVLGATPPGSPQVTPAAAAAAAEEEGLDVLDATVLSDAEAERLEQRKIAEYLSKKGPGSSAQLPSRAAPGFLQQQRQQRQRGYGQGPLVAQQQLPVQRSAAAGGRPGGGRASAAVDAEAQKARQHKQQQRQQEQQEAARKAQAVSAAAAEKAAASAAAAAALPGFVSLQELLVLAQQLLLHPHSVAVRKESAALLLQLQPDPLARLQQLQKQLPAACAALAHSTPGAVSVPGTELCALLMETIAELLVLSCRGSNPPAVDASSTGGAADSDSSSRSHAQASAMPTSLPPPAAAAAAAAKTVQVSATTARAALSGLLAAVCQQLAGQVSGLLQQEQQLWPGQRAPAAPARTAALPMLLEQVEQLLIGLAQLQPHHHHHHHALSPRHHTHHQQQQQGGEGEGAAGWVDAVCLQQLLWSLGGLDALTAGRTAASQAAAQQLHRLLKQGWLQGGAAAAAAGQAGGGRDGAYGDSDSAGDEVEDEFTEADEYETELEGEEDEGEGEEERLSEFADGHEGAAAAGGSGGKLLSRLPPLSADVLAQRQAQLVEALVRVLASEVRRYDQQQQQQLSAQPSVAPPAAAAGASSGLSWRSSLALCSSLVVLLCSAVSPEKPPPSYQLLLEKAATQEEFIPGQLPSGGLVTSATLAAAAAGGGGGGGSGEGGAAAGPLMRDVKNYICRRLDMTGLLDDDFGMELLVGGSLISLALPVLDVLTHHWGPLYQQQQAGRGGRTAAGAGGGGSSGGGGVSPGVPMPVTFRLSGLDGEATEPQVKELNPGQAAGQYPDDEAVLAGVLARGQGTGLGLLLQLLLIAHQQPVRALRRVSGQLLQLLKASVGQAECRRQLLQQGALGCLLHLVHLAVKPLLAASSSAGSRGAGVDRTASLQAAGGALGCGITGAQLLLLLEALQELVTEANRSGQPVQLGAMGPPEAAVPSSPLQQTQQQQQVQQQQQRQAAGVAGLPAASAAASPTSSSSSSAPLTISAARVSSSSTEVAQLADGLSVLEARGLGSCAAVLAKLLTALAQHSSTAQLGLIKHFAPALDLQALDEAATAAGGTDATAGAVVGAANTTQAGTAAAAQGELGAEAGEGDEEEEGEAPLLAAVHAEAGGTMSAHEHCLQLKAFLRLIEALSNSTAPSSGSSGTVAAAPSAAGREQQAGSTAAVTDFKQLVLEQGVPGRLADYLLAAFRPPPSSQSSSSGAALLQPGAPAWAAAAARPGVPFALQLLTALAQGHAPTAAGLAAQQPCLLQLLHLLEGTAGGSTITPLAEACLEALARAGAAAVAGSIADLRAATVAEMKARAARKRAALLASMGMVQVEAAAAAGGGVKIVPSPGAVPALSPLAAELAALEGGVADDDEGGNVCMVCREGYALQPTTLLGCYCFCRVAAAAEWPGCGPPWGTPHDLLLTTVSHFNLIHTQCHAAAKAADASLRQPKREWQGATLRNGNVLCNSLLPLAAPAGGKVETAYAAAVTSFWQQQLSAPSAREAAAATGSSGGTAGGSGGGSSSDAAAVAVAVSLSRRSSALREADGSLLRMSLVAADLATLLWRFSAQLSFSEEARGGGRASNARLLFALLQLGRYYVVEAPTSELRQAQKLLAAAGGAAAALGLEAAAPAAAPGTGGGSSAAAPTAACSADDLAELSSHAPFVLALSLLCMGPADWMAARRSMLVLAARAGAARALQQQQAAGRDSMGGSSHRRSSSGAPAAAGAAGSSSGLSDEALYVAAAPMLRLFGFVDWLHQWAKPAVGSGSESGGSSGSGGWGGAMAQQLADLAGCAQAAGELLEVADEAEGAFGLQDLLDGLGCLGVALGPKSASVEEFLRGAVAGL